MRGEQLRAEGADRVQVFQGPQPVPHQGAFHARQVLVDVDLYDGSGLGGQPGGGTQGALGGRLGDGDGQGSPHQRVAVVAGEVLLGPLHDVRTAVAAGSVVGVVADESEHTADPGVPRGGGDHLHVHVGAGPGVGDGGETPAQRLQRGQLGRGVRGLLVQRALQRYPDPAEDLRGFPEGERGAEALGEVVVRVHETGHQQPAGQPHRPQPRMGAPHGCGGRDRLEPAVADHDGPAVDGTLGEQDLVRL